MLASSLRVLEAVLGGLEVKEAGIKVAGAGVQDMEAGWTWGWWVQVSRLWR